MAVIKRGQKIDTIGNISFAGAITLVLSSITLYATDSAHLSTALTMLVGGVAIFFGFVYYELRINHPMFDLKLFKIILFAAGNLAILLNAVARGAVTFVLVLNLQGPTMRLNPFEAGLFLVPTSISLSLFGPVSGRLSDRYGARLLSTVGLIVSAIGFVMLARLGRTTTFGELVVPLVFIGSGMGIFASPNRASIMNSVPPPDRGIASGMSSTLVSVGQIFSMGMAFYVISLTVPMKSLAGIFLGTSTGGPAGPWINDFINSIHYLFLISTGILLIAIIPSVLRGNKLTIPETIPHGASK